MSLISRIWTSLIIWLPWKRRNWLAVHVEDEPNELESNRVYLIMEENEVWQAALICPCGCHAKIQLCCVKESRPRWSYNVHSDQTVTLHPSVWRTKGCRSHFFIRRGKIKWC